jgi:hypothetical protein
VDNQSVVKNSSLPESTLKKKSHSIAYHYVRENVANGTIRIGYESTTTNLADCLSKPQSGAKRRELVSQIIGEQSSSHPATVSPAAMSVVLGTSHHHSSGA